jgi:hypothetical protein
MTKSRGILRPKHKWTAEEDVQLTLRYPIEKAGTIAANMGIPVYVIYKRAEKLGLKKSEEFFASAEQSGRLDGIRGSSTRFQKGNVPWTQGTRGQQMSPETQFKPGQRPVNYMPPGSEKMHMGYVWVKISEGGWPDAWRPKHHVVWKERHGSPPPATHMLTFRDRNRTNFAIENLELVSRQDWMKRHTLHNLPKELAEMIQLRGAVTRQINKRTKNGQ